MNVMRAEAKPSNAELLDSLFHPLGADGVYGRTGIYESVIDGLSGLVTRMRPGGAETLRFPPVVPRALIEKSGYLKSFPHLLGCVCALSGDEPTILAAAARAASGQTWTDALAASDLVLAPAACYPAYAIAAKRGPLPKQGLIFDVACDCFRREPSKDVDRFQSFRMREFVMIGSAAHVDAFRAQWLERAEPIAEALGLDHRIDAANDPFFGRGGVLAARTQLADQLKFELLIPVKDAGGPTACMSFNAHRDHFGKTWDLRDADGEVAHSACVAFGMDRLAVALFAKHGLDAARWPGGVKARLGL